MCIEALFFCVVFFCVGVQPIIQFMYLYQCICVFSVNPCHANNGGCPADRTCVRVNNSPDPLCRCPKGYITDPNDNSTCIGESEATILLILPMLCVCVCVCVNPT